MAEYFEILGVPASPYTRKLIALMRYRSIPFRVIWGTHDNPPEGYPSPPVKLLPTLYVRDDNGSHQPLTDTTPIARRLERDYTSRRAIPAHPELAFYNDLIEDYADEWLTKIMFHYRWYDAQGPENAGPLLAYMLDLSRREQDAAVFSNKFGAHQIGRLSIVGSNDITAPLIEESYRKLLDILDGLIARRGFVLGARPSVADFSLFGQLVQLGQIEPTSAKIMADTSPRLRAWLDLMDDLSGLDVANTDDDWFTPSTARAALAPLLAEITRTYLPFLQANATAFAKQETNIDTLIDGARWTQPVFPYQVKCLDILKQSFASSALDTSSELAQYLAE